MTSSLRSLARLRLVVLTLLLALVACTIAGETPQQADFIPTGQWITPLVAPGSTFSALDPELPELPDFHAGQAVALVPSPDHRQILVLTSGYNRNFNASGAREAKLSNEYVFVYDMSATPPRKTQVIQLPDTFVGIAWNPDGNGFYVSGGVDDRIYSFARRGDGSFAAAGDPIALGHAEGLGVRTKPAAAGLAVSPDGTRLLVVNFENDSVSLVDLEARRVLGETDLRPGKTDPARHGIAGGEFPFAVAWGAPGKAYVTSQRDREIVVLRIAGDRTEVAGRIAIAGQPNAVLMSRDRSRLFIAADNSDSVVVIDTLTDVIAGEIAMAPPPSILANPLHLKGANPNGLALSPDERTLFVTLGGLNAVAVVRVGPEEDPDGDGDVDATSPGAVLGLIPTGWYPDAVGLDAAGRQLVIVNAKSPPGPNVGACRDGLSIVPGSLAACLARNRYVWQLEKAGILSLPVPDGAALARLTRQVARNNNFPSARTHPDQDRVMAFLRQHIRHVVYVVKENRSYDQVLGDLALGNGDPNLAILGERLSPNHHALARDFVTLDNFFDSGETSNTGWNWSTAARTTDFTEKTAPVNYANRGLHYDSEGLNRLVNVGIANPAERRKLNPAIPDDPDLLPGTADVAAPDGGGSAGTGYLWDAALRAGRTLRNFGFFGDFTLDRPLLREPFKDDAPVFVPTKAALQGVSDPYYRGFDMRLPDFWRFKEWEREFDGMIAKGNVPDLMLVRLPNDHFGSFAAALDGVDTVEKQMADNDYALGLLVEKIAHSGVRDETIVVALEDDAQAGADHVDAHRSLVLVAGPYVKRRAVVSTRYTTVSVLRTIEEILGLTPLGLNDGLADPMIDLFDMREARWTFDAVVPEPLRQSRLPLPPLLQSEAAPERCTPPHDAAFWEERMRGQDFSIEDRLDVKRFNEALWSGLKGEGAAPPVRDGGDRRANRAALIAAARICQDETQKEPPWH